MKTRNFLRNILLNVFRCIVKKGNKKRAFKYVDSTMVYKNEKLIADEIKVLAEHSMDTTSDFTGCGINILSLGLGIKQDGTNTSLSLYNALKYCKDNNFSAFIPKGVYTVGPLILKDETNWKCVPIPDGLTLYIETGAVFKLVNDAAAWSRIIVPGNNVTIHGELRIDGSAETITAGNEHMAGLFIYDKRNINIDTVISENCYGDNVQITGGSSSYSDAINIDCLRCRKAGRKNLVFEAANGIHIKNAYLDNNEGNSLKEWSGGGCLDVEPFSMGENTFHNRIDYLETLNNNEFTAGTTAEEAGKYRLDIGTLVQRGGSFLSYAMTISIDNAYFGENFTKIDMMYGADIIIGRAHFKKPLDAVIVTQYSSGNQPRLLINNMFIEGDPTIIPVNPAIYWRGSSLFIGKIRVDNYNNKVIWSQYTGEDLSRGSDFSIGELVSNDSGLPGSSLIYLDYYSSRGSCGIEHLIVRDSRDTKLNKIIEYSDSIAMNDFKVSKLHNPDILPIYGTEYGNFNAYHKLAGIDNSTSIVMVDVNPEGKITLPKGSVAIRTNAFNEPAIYLKETDTGNVGWIPLLADRKGTTSERPVIPWTGMYYYDQTIKKPVWADVIGKKEVVILKISEGATISGKITIALNGVATTVSVLAGDTAGTIGDKIRATAISDWVVSGKIGSATVKFTKNYPGINIMPVFTGTDTTGVTASFTVTTAGTNNEWIDAMSNLI
ncbi:hypothetical protein FC682_24020 [Peribacillus simplex]|uniref:hypothetical protein n=1 Tax=Peribacillus simplex TaxID=1478 RepID=UPI0010BE5233|nr:hypothetical protein [Peribacillus simplex]TKH00650.1 hypothetical protein FC682_24020 [Peribacillus simplex]